MDNQAVFEDQAKALRITRTTIDALVAAGWDSLANFAYAVTDQSQVEVGIITRILGNPHAVPEGERDGSAHPDAARLHRFYFEAYARVMSN